MKIFLISSGIFLLSFTSKAQDSLQTKSDCDQREAMLVETMNTLSAGFLYNTYAVIGSISDGFQSDTYDGKMSFSLLTAQKKMLDGTIIILQRSLDNNLYRNDVNKMYTVNYIGILKGFNAQIDMLQKIVKNNTKKNIDVYSGLRNESWAQMNTLMGIRN